jgi:photosystem II stability/assembly factor-like uncharacterized protein
MLIFSVLIIHMQLKRPIVLTAIALVISFIQTSFAQKVDPALLTPLKWRMIGPHRGGRTVGAVGVPQQPNVFYIGVNNGGVWKTTDFGRTWFPVFDDQPTGSIGDVVVSPSNPNVIYVGSGEGLQRPDLSVGDGIYKSNDAGKTWQHIGLKDAQQIGGMSIDPNNENRVFVAALGHPYGPNTERGVFRTTDGGKTWEKVFYIDENTGAIQVTFDPKNTNILYAAMWAGRQGPWENGAWNGANSGLFKSTDGGTTWKKLTNGLPTTAQGLGRIGFAVAPTDANRLYATVESPQLGGIYRSDDAGENWYRTTNDNRYYGRASDFAELKVDPTNADVVYSANVVAWKSTDGAKTWSAFRGAPGGDDYHRIWINPNNKDIILIASDQGAIITVNGGETFSSWYNQPTAQFYHVITDNEFPYNVYGGQQESGSVGITSRSLDGAITYRDWHPVGVEEYGYVAPDPLNPNIIYGGKITKHNKRTGQTQNIAPEAVRSGKYRFLRTAPVIFSPADKKTLFYAGNVLFKTTNGGSSWDIISPDLSRESWDIPESVGIYTNEQMKTMPRRGVIYTIAPSHKNVNTIWAGTDDGLIHITRDGGKTWTNITPSSITSWSKISLIDASRFDDNTAYAAVNRIRNSDMKPHIYRTHDGGKTWKEIVNGLPNDPINAVREDPYVKGLLYAGSERAVYVSFDDGENWQSLRNNMPATSIRDLVIKDDDIVVGTHGRSFWILDNITPLRQRASFNNNVAVLFKPQKTYRVRWSTYQDTPVPQEEAAGENPPDGVMIDYVLPAKANEVVLQIKDSKGNIVRTFTSKEKPYTNPQDNTPPYWIRPQQILSAQSGSHRFLWDLHYDPLETSPSYSISGGVVYKNTAPDASSPWVMPGNYTVNLIVDGKTISQPLTVVMDPRIKTTTAQLQEQHDLATKAYYTVREANGILTTLQNLRKQADALKGKASQETQNALTSLVSDIEKVEPLKPVQGAMTLSRIRSAYNTIMDNLIDNDMPVTNTVKNTLTETDKTKEIWSEQLRSIQSKVKAINILLQKENLTPLELK